MTITTREPSAEAQIRALIEGWAEAVRANDIGEIMSHYVPDVLAFDAIAQLQFKGADAYGKHWQACLTMCPGPMIFELHDLSIQASGDLAFGHCLLRCGARAEDGEEKSGWMRLTGCYRKHGGRWKIAHEHVSVPFDIESGKALLGLEPESIGRTVAA